MLSAISTNPLIQSTTEAGPYQTQLEQDELDENTYLFAATDDKEENCSHWGLSHWFSGIGEYFERCFDGCRSSKKNGRYVVESRYSNEIAHTTDCLICTCHDNELCIGKPGECGGIICGCCSLICGTLCCPLAATIHLCCLPIICFQCSEQKPSITKLPRPQVHQPTPHRLVPQRTPISPSANDYKHANCTWGVCHPGPPHQCPKHYRDLYGKNPL